MSDKVNHPTHYTSHPSGVECIQITEHYNFCIGNAIKYIWRAGLKDEAEYDPIEKEIEDCEKAIWYIKRHISRLEKMRKVVPLTNKEKVELINAVPASKDSGTNTWYMDREAVARALGSNIQVTKTWLDCND